MYKVLWAPSARRQLANSIPPNVGAAIWAFVTQVLAEQPHRVGKPLHNELAGRWVARRGEYRVIYRIDDETRTISIVALGHRRGIYHRR